VAFFKVTIIQRQKNSKVVQQYNGRPMNGGIFNELMTVNMSFFKIQHNSIGKYNQFPDFK